MEPTRLADDAAWEAARAAPAFLIFKHSPRCSVSTAAHSAWQAWLEANPDAASGIVDVVDHRELSRKIAAETGVDHQSPQAIWLTEGRVVWHASHWEITGENLTRSRPV